MKMFSQFNEDEIIESYFGSQIGQFIDIGAAGGVVLSNSFALVQRGWNGICVEPSPVHFLTLLENHRYNNVRLINGALWVEHGLVRFTLNSSWYSRLHSPAENADMVGSYLVPAVTAADLKQLQPHADFISIDCEGEDIVLFPGIVQAFPTCRLYCVEHGKSEAVKLRWRQLFVERGLRVIGETSENFLAGR